MPEQPTATDFYSGFFLDYEKSKFQIEIANFLGVPYGTNYKLSIKADLHSIEADLLKPVETTKKPTEVRRNSTNSRE